ncbi:MAG: hypothetical protein ACHQSE_07630 [Gemmatimonadales bacterium]
MSQPFGLVGDEEQAAAAMRAAAETRRAIERRIVILNGLWKLDDWMGE